MPTEPAKPDRPAVTDRVAYWDRYATGIRAAEAPEIALKNAFGWTQYEGHGPGDELLGEPATALELGSSRGHAVAALATKGIDATGVDLSSVQIEGARQQWGHLPNARFVHADVIPFLTESRRRWEAIYSIFGALWFTDPDQWMPLVRARLSPGGKLVFSCAPAVPGTAGVQGMYGAGFTGPQVWIYRWTYEPQVWARMLTGAGFGEVTARVEPAPNPENVGTLIVQARA
ncbi:SAM-dependent methyltransferase [Nonomuraea thailandensis]|uniref:SAM-dependent methyltransferase n=1 Tax=Nonomuraea thailandensis TaxID=1188745 RepID=A0A9X2GEY4_9ACTN|nr:class I SAM-dependent methyltransferase [Nonomuraea thailandensis]MCP2353418.1 SAM-dependent methyltransferase [Nonomuraea thailandensis]